VDSRVEAEVVVSAPNTALELTALVAFGSAIAACVFLRRSSAFVR
jgi:hypothetical protein